jgi:dienelactone hydrolase
MLRPAQTGLALAALAAALVYAPPALAQQGFQVGIPGCADDVPVQAWRETITFESGGRDIRAHLYSPRVEPNGRAIVLLHGGTGWEMNAILFDAHAIQLASRGYWVILPAYFDAARPDGSRRLVTARAWRRAALDAARFVGSQQGVRADALALWGYSRGAGLAVSAGLEAGSPVSSVIGAATGGTLDDSPRTDVPVLLLHARTDELVPASATRELGDALNAAGVSVEVQELDFDGHRFDLPTWCAAFASSRRFLEIPD